MLDLDGICISKHFYHIDFDDLQLEVQSNVLDVLPATISCFLKLLCSFQTIAITFS